MANAAQRRAEVENWWHYNWLKCTAGAVALFLAGHLVFSSVTAPKFDLQVAVIASEVYPDAVLQALSDALAPYASDLNGDGKAAVNVVQYVVDFRTENAAKTDTRRQAAGVSGMLADLRACYTQVFLVADPDGFSLSTGALRYRDGTLPADGVYPTWRETCYRWRDCPALTALELGRYDATLYGGSGNAVDWYEDLYIGSRGFWDDTAPKYPAANEALWQALTAGAKG